MHANPQSRSVDVRTSPIARLLVTALAVLGVSGRCGGGNVGGVTLRVRRR